MIFCYCYSSSNAANMKGGEVETNKQTVTVDKKKTYFTLYQTKKGIIDSESTNVFSLILLALLNGPG